MAGERGSGDCKVSSKDRVGALLHIYVGSSRNLHVVCFVDKQPETNRTGVLDTPGRHSLDDMRTSAMRAKFSE